MEVVAFYHPQDVSWSQIQGWLAEMQRQFPHHLVAIDITEDAALYRQFRGETPLLEIGPYVLRPPFTKEALQVTLAAAQERVRQQHVTAPHSDRMHALERFSYWLARHFLALFLGFLTLYVALPWLAPVFMKIGWETPARLIYRAYSITCHQLAFRSWFLFGEQPAYPRAAANIPGLKTFGEVTGIDENDLWAARAFLGNEQVGYKVALCERDVAIWGAFWLFTLLFSLAYLKGWRLPALPWYLWLLIGWTPIGLDGVTQLLSQIPGSFIPYRESTPFLRTLTGFIFGWTTAWFMVPLMLASMEETRALYVRKARILAARRLAARKAAPMPEA